MKLTQRQSAEKAGTAQSTVAAYERGTKDPTMKSLLRLLPAAGFDLRMRLEPHDDHDETLEAWRATLERDVREGFRRDQEARVRRAKADLGFV